MKSQKKQDTKKVVEQVVRRYFISNICLIQKNKEPMKLQQTVPAKKPLETQKV